MSAFFASSSRAAERSPKRMNELYRSQGIHNVLNAKWYDLMEKKRYPEIDFLRTVAIIGMIVYHTAFDLAIFYGWKIAVFAGGWKILARGTAILFLLLVGVSFVLSFRTDHSYQKYLKRGLTIFAWGILISVVTFIVNPDTYVRFGILHLIGVSTLLLPFLASFNILNLAIGATLILLGTVVGSLHADIPFLLPLGISPRFFSSVDYFPLVPWLGMILIGMGLGSVLYNCNVLWRPQFLDTFPAPFTWPGQNALWIYLLHQPILILILSMALRFPF